MHEWQAIRFNAYNFIEEVKKYCIDGRIFHVHGSFGDVYWQLAVLKEISFQEKFNLIIDRKYHDLVNLSFSKDIRILNVDGNYLNNLLNTTNIIGNSSGNIIRLLPTIYPMIPELLLKGKLDYTVFLRELVGSDKSGKLMEIENSELDDIIISEIRSKGLRVGRTMIISADNNTHIEFSHDFWGQIINLLIECNWDICLNDSGTLNSNKSIIFDKYDFPKIKIPPSQAVRTVSIAGSYMVGTNGFAGIQAAFNSNMGFHFINGINAENGFIKDKSGNKYLLEFCYHKNFFKNQFLGSQNEILVSNNYLDYNFINNLKIKLL